MDSSSQSTPVYEQEKRLPDWKHYWFPPDWEPYDDPCSSAVAYQEDPNAPPNPPPLTFRRRTLRRRIYLVLTEPESSATSALFFGILVVAISLMNIVMVFQTMDAFQYTPQDCRTCGGPVSYVFESDDATEFAVDNNSLHGFCVCPPTPMDWTETFLKWCIYGFSVEWVLRVLTFAPSANDRAPTLCGRFEQWVEFTFFTASTVLDALSIFPYYLEEYESNGLMSLRLLRLFRVFQLVRLGNYNETFKILTTVLLQAVPYLKLLLGVLAFGAAFFGSIMYYLEKGDWKYFEESDSYQFVQIDPTGQESISPFYSIPSAFWWFLVTATTVGYGDYVPTTAAGKWVAVAAMLMGVLVVAFPVSVFSELWSRELRRAGIVAMAVEGNNEEDATVADNVTIAKTESSTLNSTSGYYGSVEDPQLLTPQRSSSSKASASGTMAAVHEDASAAMVSSSNPFHTAQGGGHSRGRHYDIPGKVVMDSDDLVELISQMETIKDSQQVIKSILKKYRIPTSTRS